MKKNLDYASIYQEILKKFPSMNTEDMIEALLGHAEMRVMAKKAPTERACHLLVKHLSEMDSNIQIQLAIVDRATVRGWLDFYDLQPQDRMNILSKQSKKTDLPWQ